MKSIGAACAALILLACGQSPVNAEDVTVKATEGGIAIGGNVTNSTIGVPDETLNAIVEEFKKGNKALEDLNALRRKPSPSCRRQLDLNENQIRAAFDILGEKDIPPERLGAKLVEIAQKFKDLESIAAAQPGDDAEVTALKNEAEEAIKAGALGHADDLLAEIDAKQAAAEDRLAANRAATKAKRGEVALAQLRYADAAKRFAEAAHELPEGEEYSAERLGYLNSEASALYQQGDEFGDNAALASAIDRYRRILELSPRERVPLDWATTQNNLGNALARLGERESGTARLEEAVAAYRAALEERTRERVPLDWAMTQNNLGTALSSARGAGERHGAAGGGGRRLSRRARGTDPRARAARLGDDAEQPRHCAPSARGAGERHGAAGGGGRRLSRRARGTDPRARAARLGDDAEQPRQCAREPRGAGERHGAAGGGGRRLSRRARGTDPRARAARLGDDAEQPRQCARERSGSGRAARRGWRRRSPPIAPRSRNGPASACRSTGRRRRTTSAMRSRASGSGRAARRGWRRRSPPIAPRSRNGPASACRSTGPRAPAIKESL